MRATRELLAPPAVFALACGGGGVPTWQQQRSTNKPRKQDVTLPCPFRPGEYSYEIWLFEGGVADPAAGMAAPTSRMPAKIVVEGG